MAANELLEQELGSAPVGVRIRGKEYRLAYPIAAVILYKQKTGDNLFKINSWVTIDQSKEQGDPDRYLFALDANEDPDKFLSLVWAGAYGGALVDGGAPTPDEPSRLELGRVITSRNLEKVKEAVIRALLGYLIVPPDETGGVPDPMPAEIREPALAGK